MTSRVEWKVEMSRKWLGMDIRLFEDRTAPGLGCPRDDR